jgi:hypothetical protein
MRRERCDVRSHRTLARSFVAVRGNFVDLEGKEVATPELAVDSKVEQREVSSPSFDL